VGQIHVFPLGSWMTIPVCNNLPGRVPPSFIASCCAIDMINHPHGTSFFNGMVTIKMVIHSPNHRITMGYKHPQTLGLYGLYNPYITHI